MSKSNKIDVFDFVILAVILFYLYKTQQNSLSDYIVTFAFVDVLTGVYFILKGFIKGEMSYVAAGAICAMMGGYGYKDISTFNLVIQVLGLVLGVSTYIRKSLKKII